MNNDVSFIISSELFLLEQQSTVNGNMPLRFLLYVADMYRAMINLQRLYGGSVQRIPAPRFIVFFNGSRNSRDKRWNRDKIELKLSDCFKKETADPQLELKVNVFNINQGHNEELLKKCQVLNEYSLFVHTVENHIKKETDIDTAVKKGVQYCIDTGILKDFLKKNRDRVISMLISNYTSYDYERDMQTEIEDLKSQTEEMQQTITDQKEQLSVKDQQLSVKDQQLSDKDQRLSALKKLISDQNQVIVELKKQLEEKS